MLKDEFKTEYFECICHSDEHTLKWEYMDLPDEKTVSLGTCVFLNCDFSKVYGFYWVPSWLMRFLDWSMFIPARRFWIAVKYFCGYKCKYGEWDVFDLKYEDCDRLIELIRKYKAKHEEYRKGPGRSQALVRKRRRNRFRS